MLSLISIGVFELNDNEFIEIFMTQRCLVNLVLGVIGLLVFNS